MLTCSRRITQLSTLFFSVWQKEAWRTTFGVLQHRDWKTQEDSGTCRTARAAVCVCVCVCVCVGVCLISVGFYSQTRFHVVRVQLWEHAMLHLSSASPSIRGSLHAMTCVLGHDGRTGDQLEASANVSVRFTFDMIQPWTPNWTLFSRWQKTGCCPRWGQSRGTLPSTQCTGGDQKQHLQWKTDHAKEQVRAQQEVFPPCCSEGWMFWFLTLFMFARVSKMAPAMS